MEFSLLLKQALDVTKKTKRNKLWLDNPLDRSSKPYKRLAIIQVLRRMARKNAENKVYSTCETTGFLFP
jgi:hypothetical protein